jgi:hypothetical protein
MDGDKMDVEAAEKKMSTMEHSEQHYFKRSVTATWTAISDVGIFD